MAALSHGPARLFGSRFRCMRIAPATGAFCQLVTMAVMVASMALVVDRPWTLPTPGAEV